MKRIVASIGVLALFLAGCPANQKLVERIEKMEKRIEALEARPALPSRAGPPAQETAYTIPTEGSPMLGNKNAPITVTVFSDFQCPFCGRVDPMLREIVDNPELKDKVKVVFKQFPLSFHQNAKPASKAALAAMDLGGDAAFWKMADVMFKNQQNLTPANFSKWAKEIGLDQKKFETTLKDNDAKYESSIKVDMEIGTKNAQVRGTPSIYVGGWELRERSVDGIKKLIESKNLIPGSKPAAPNT